MLRWLNPNLNPTLVGTTAATCYAAGAMLYRAYVTHDAVLDWDLLGAAAAAVWQVWTYLKVTPIADPKDGNGRQLVAARSRPQP